MKLSHLIKHSCLVLVSALALCSFAAPAANASSVRGLSAVRTSNHVSNSQKLNHRNKFNRVFKIAKSKLGRKYVYGATGPHNFDCSGFTKYIYKRGAHVDLPRTAQAQYDSLDHAHHANKGELVFFGRNKRSISHVGMCISRRKMIDAQNRGVVIENIHAPWWHRVGYAKPFAN